MRGLILTILLTVAAANPDSLRTAFGKESVPTPKKPGATTLADTLDTGNPDVKVVLYSDHTWRYIRDEKKVSKTKVFTEYWKENITNPYYGVALESLPDKVTLWIVDTLDSYCCPNKTQYSSLFGYRHGRRHQGIDLPYPTGTPVYAAFDGKVRMADWNSGYGNLVVLRHANGLETYYGHCSELKVKAGDWVHAGDVIALGGSTGRSSGPHLHFETRYKGYAFDPMWLIDFKTGDLRHRLFTLRKRYFDANSRYVQEEDDEDVIAEGDEKDRIAAEQKAREEAIARQKAAEAAMQYYVIKSGDTLSKIAAKYHTSVNTLCRLNGMTVNTKLQIGKRIRVK
ncbi:MAG: peptidoglycan DD-metalloendopeptidase family protein [Bacteroidales bacterium]|nr:peptidoglycan DD-metalloendopeptidase family protein [Bacteroidales bacterium]